MPLSKCKRCGGEGRIPIRFGVPGQDTHLAYNEVIWQAPLRFRDCDKCMATGWGKPDYLPNADMLITFDERGRPHRTPLEGSNETDSRRADGFGPQDWP